MLSLLRPVNIEIRTTEDQSFINRKMDLSKPSLTNISVKQQKEDYSLKKETFAATSSDNHITLDERSNIADKSSDDEGKKTFLNDSEQYEKRPGLIMADTIKPYDILCGRDKATFNNIGNRRFRVLISLNIPRYEKATTKAEKASVIKYICDIFRHEVGVRFLKKHKTEDGYYELSVSEARKKVGHALRDMSVARQEVKKRREEMRRNSLTPQNTQTISDIDLDPTLEPLPIDDETTRRAQEQQHQKLSSNQQANMTVRWIDRRQSKPSSIPELLTQHLQPQQPHAHTRTTLEERILDLQRQQEEIQQQQEELLRQRQQQQDLLRQQIRNRRMRNQQEEQSHQQQQYNKSDGVQQFDHIFDLLSRRR